MKEMALPPWVVLHVPHDSTDIPAAVRSQFVLPDDELAHEVIAMTDRHTYRLFGADALGDRAIRAPVSRLVLDVERFEDDSAEPMASRGMGVIYSRTSSGKRLRRVLSPDERQELLERFYRPHHAALGAAVDSALRDHGRCLVLDCHSFPAVALPYEQAAGGGDRPDICIGTDEFHTPQLLAQAFTSEFASAGWTVKVNDPFAGALVPAGCYRRDSRVASIMVEINRSLYMDEKEATPFQEFEAIRERIRVCCARAVAQLE